MEDVAAVVRLSRPISRIGKAGAGVFYVDGKVGEEWKNLSMPMRITFPMTQLYRGLVQARARFASRKL